MSLHMQLVKGDIQSADLIGHLLIEHKVDTVMHFAAQVRSLKLPLQASAVGTSMASGQYIAPT